MNVGTVLAATIAIGLATESIEARQAADAPAGSDIRGRDQIHIERIKRLRGTVSQLDPGCWQQLRELCSAVKHPTFDCATIEQIQAECSAAMEKAEHEFEVAVGKLDVASQDALEDGYRDFLAGYYTRQASAAGNSEEDQRAMGEWNGRIAFSPFQKGVSEAALPCRAAQEEALVLALSRLRSATVDVRALSEAAAVIALDLGGCTVRTGPNTGSDYQRVVSPTEVLDGVMVAPDAPAAQCLLRSGLVCRWKGSSSVWTGDGTFGQLGGEYLLIASEREIERRGAVARLLYTGASLSTDAERREIQTKINRIMRPVREASVALADEYVRRLLAAAAAELERCPDSEVDARLREVWLRRVCPLLGARQWLEDSGSALVLSLVEGDVDRQDSVRQAIEDFRKDLANARSGSIEPVMAVRRMIAGGGDSYVSDEANRQHKAIADRLWGPQDRAIDRIRGSLQGDSLARFDAAVAAARADPRGKATRPRNWVDLQVAQRSK